MGNDGWIRLPSDDPIGKSIEMLRTNTIIGDVPC